MTIAARLLLGSPKGEITEQQGPADFSVIAKDGESVITWTNPALFTNIEVDQKETLEDDTEYTNIYTGTLATYTDTSLDPGKLYSYRISATGSNGRSVYSILENRRPSHRKGLYKDKATSIIILDAKRADSVFNDTTFTTEAANAENVKSWKNLSTAPNSPTVKEADVDENFTYNKTSGFLAGVGGITNNKEHFIMNPALSLSDCTVIVGFKHDGTTNGARIFETQLNTSALRKTSNTKWRCITNDTTPHDFTVPAMSAGDYVGVLTVDSTTDPALTQLKWHLNNNTPITPTVAVAGLTTWDAGTIGNSGASERSMADGTYFIEVKNYVLSPTEITDVITDVTASFSDPVEDWTPEADVGGDGSTRPILPDYLDSSVGMVLTKPPVDASIFDFRSFNQPSWVMTETKKVVAEERFTIANAITAQTTSSEKQVQLQNIDSNVVYGWHRSPRASQAHAIKGKEHQQGAGMAMAGFGPTTFGTTQNPVLYPKHIVPGAATTLTTALSINGTTFNVANQGVLKTSRFAILYEGNNAGDISWDDCELCHIGSLPGSTQVNLSTNGDFLARGYFTTKKAWPIGTYCRFLLTAAGSGPANFQYNYLDDASLEDAAGRRPWEAQAYFMEQNWNRNKLGQIIAGFSPKLLFYDVHIEYLPNNKDADPGWSSTVNTFTDGWNGQTNLYDNGIQKFNDRVATSFPTMVVNYGYELSASPEKCQGFQSETGTGGGHWNPTVPFEDGDHVQQLCDAWNHLVKNNPFVCIDQKNRDYLWHEDLTPNISWGYKLSRHNFSMSAGLDIHYCKQNYNQGTNGSPGEFPYYPEIAVYRGQTALQGKGYQYGQCLFPYDGTTSYDDIKAARGWLGKPKYEWYRIIDPAQYNLTNTLLNVENTSDITGWTKTNCSIEHNATDGALEMTGWTGGAKPWWPTAIVKSPSFSWNSNKTYTISTQVRSIDPVKARQLRIGINTSSQDKKQLVYATREWTTIIINVQPHSTASSQIFYECGIYPELFQIKNVRVWEGNTRLYRCDLDHGIAVWQGAGSPTRTLDLKGSYKMPLYNYGNKATYDPENRLNGQTITEITLTGADGALLLNPE